MSWATLANVLLLLLLLSAGLARPQLALNKSVHTVFTTDCSQYFNWQALGIYHSFQKSKQPGPITRLLSCTEEQLKQFKDVDGIPTHHAPSWTIHPITGDNYSGINKPVAVRDWLNKTQPKEDYILVIDSDTIMREPFVMTDLDLRPGWAISGFYGYLKGVKNELANRYLPGIEPRKDALAGPLGRKSDQVGGFTFMHREDLRRMADEWVTITEEVRADSDAWKLSGDIFTKKPGDKPWIAEMYGYSFAAARANIWHHTNNRVMLYPGYTPIGIPEAPNVLHYGIKFGIDQAEPMLDWQFDKHWYIDFQPLKCNPWAKADKSGRLQEGLFPSPPHPSNLTSKGVEKLRDLLAIETVATLNEALCMRHTSNCPPSTELDSVCQKVYELSKAVASAQKALAAEPGLPCKDDNELCEQWASRGECERNPTYMTVSCRAACSSCSKSLKAPKKQSPAERKTGGTHGDAGHARETNEVVKKTIDSLQNLDEVSIASRKAHEVIQSTQDLVQRCLSDTRLSKAQVKACMDEARRGLLYDVPPALSQHQKSGHGQALENMGTEEMRKKPPEVRHMNTRRLGLVGHGETELWEGDHKAFIVFGGFIAALFVLIRYCFPRKGQRYKGVRRD